MKFLRVTILLYCCLFVNGVISQGSFRKDSLQIKVYTEIEYVNSRAADITVKKVFCDYCSENQLNYLSEKAKELAFYDRYNPKKRMENGIRKFAIIIRVSKKDLLAIKNDDEDNLDNPSD